MLKCGFQKQNNPPYLAWTSGRLSRGDACLARNLLFLYNCYLGCIIHWGCKHNKKTSVPKTLILKKEGFLSKIISSTRCKFPCTYPSMWQLPAPALWVSSDIHPCFMVCLRFISRIPYAAVWILGTHRAFRSPATIADVLSQCWGWMELSSLFNYFILRFS